MTYWLDSGSEAEPLDYVIPELMSFDLNEIVKENMIDFLDKNKYCVMRIDGYDVDTGEYIVRYLPMLHRWHPDYKKRVMAKTYALNQWYQKNRVPVTLITFTTRQNDLIPDQILLLNSAFNKIKKVLNRRLGRFSYMWVIEAHKSGYCHLHMLYFGDELPIELQGDGKKNRGLIRDLWENKYDAGKIIDFSFSPAQRSLNNAGGYVFKYLSKTLAYEALEDRDSGYFLLSSWVREMSRRDSKYQGVRFWGCSRDISEAMRLNLNPSPVIWFRTNIKTASGWYPLWVSPDLWDDSGNDYLIRFDAWLSVITDFPSECLSGGVN